MLGPKIASQEDAIETIFCQYLEGKEIRNMDEDETELFLRLSMNEIHPLFKEKSKEYHDLPFIMKMIMKRVKVYDFTLADMNTVFMIGSLALSPGCATMYLTMIQYYCKKKNIKSVDMKELVNIFPLGFYTEEDLKKAWDLQKIKGNPDNLLDYSSAMKSIRF